MSITNVKNTAPVYAYDGEPVTFVISAANTARDGSGILVTVYTVPTKGARMTDITFNSAQASPALNSAMVVRLFVTDTAGANPRLIRESVLPAVTPSSTAIGATIFMGFNDGLLLAGGQVIKVCQSVYAGVQDKVQGYARIGRFE
jgi:hypothetical protein